jgi:hypothetical protein
MRKLPLICASNEGGMDAQGNPIGFHTTPCEGKSCYWHQDGACSAGAAVTRDYGKWVKPETVLPSCPLADRCAWNVEAVKRGEPACGVRRLGMICEHQGGDWNTFQMADPNDAEAWG